MNREYCMRWMAALLAGLLLLANAPAEQVENGYVNFNFDNVDIRLLVKMVGEMTGKRFVMDTRMEGSVSVITQERMPVAQVYPLFLSILESSGYSVVTRGGANHIVPLRPSRLPDAPVYLETVLEPGGLITRVIPMEHVSAVDVARLLEPMIRGGPEGAVSAFAPTNHLVVTDTVDSLHRAELIIAELDRPGAARTMEVVALRHVSADDLAKQLTEALRGAETAGEMVSRHMRQVATGAALQPSESLIIPSAHGNRLVLVGTRVQLDEMKRLVDLLDVESPPGTGRLHVLFLKYLEAGEAATVLAELMDESERERHERVTIRADVANNALLVNSSPRDFGFLRELVEQIDRAPQQVLVEIMIAEVTEGSRLEFGIEWASTEQPADNRNTVIGRSRPGERDVIAEAMETGTFPRGLAVGLATGMMADGQPIIPFLLHAAAENQDVKILSRVPLWAQNNKEASVSVVDNIPILTSTIEGAGFERDVIRNIERVDVGIKLTFTPHVNPDREVTLHLHPSIEAIINEATGGQPFTPTIAKREVRTTVTVPDKATVVISGLIREDKITTVSKVPILGDIPILGALFRHSSDRMQRTNLLVFVTPHIVTDMEEARRRSDDWRVATEIDAGQIDAGPRREGSE